MTGHHNRQTDRTAHFLPRQGDTVPTHAHAFNIAAATFEYNERLFEHEQMSLLRAARLCNPPPKPRRAGTAQRGGTPRIGYDHQITKPPARSLPNRQISKKKTPERPPDLALDGLAGSLTISRVTMAPSPRRPKSTKPLVRGDMEVRKGRPEAMSAPKRYRSPPPRVTKEKACSYAAGDYQVQYERDEAAVS
jgi:hypothetical protein